MKSPILHILEDAVVVNSFINLMEASFPNESKYVILLKGGSPKKVEARENVIFFQRPSEELDTFLKNTKDYRHICLHSMADELTLLKINHPSISWVIWGGDLYEKLLQFKGYRLYESPLEQYRVKSSGRTLLTVWYLIWDFFRFYRIYRRELKILNNVRYIITDNDCDYGVYKRFFPKSNIKHLGTINYYPIENLINQSYINKNCSGSAIWVGNSASANGNHISVFKKLASFSSSIKIYCPISYGDKGYSDYLEREGRRILGEKYMPLIDFLPVEQYYSLFLNANSFVFGHYRQCAVGNILMALYFGGKCFFYKRNPLYKMYLESGFVVFSIEDDLNEEFAITPLSVNERSKNRELVNKIASYSSSIEQMKNVFSKV